MYYWRADGVRVNGLLIAEAEIADPNEIQYNFVDKYNHGHESEYQISSTLITG